MKQTKQIYIVAGANGSGKTTISKELLKEEKLEFLNADEIAYQINPTNIDKVKLSAGKIFFKKFKAYIKAESSFIIESTLSGKYLQKYISILKSNHYKITMLYIFLDNWNIANFRVKERVKLGGHFISEEDVKRRFFRSQKNFWNKYRLLVDEWSFIYNGDDFIDVAKGIENNYTVLNEIRFEKFLNEVND
ncbi:MAG: AAA family ATPase [bacterium]|nr:AAA family ATPase [bacterium]